MTVRSLLGGIFVLLLLASAGEKRLAAQEYIPTAVEISSEKVRINGRLFYVHRVLPRQTLFSIAKAYGVSTDELMHSNPALKDGLKAGSLLYIPVSADKPAGTVSETFRTGPETAPEESAAGSRNAGTESVRRPPEGSIPVAAQEKVSENDSVPAARIPDKREMRKRFKRHTAKWYESLDDIASRYGVPVRALIDLNRLESNRLARRQVLYIPDSEWIREWETAGKGLDAPETDARETVEGNPREPGVPVPDLGLYPNRKRSRIVSIVVPLSRHDGSPSVNQADFVCGALLAWDELAGRSEASGYRLNVIDLGEYLSPEDLVYSGILSQSELIIGPVSAADIAPVASYAQFERIPLVSPMDPKAADLLTGNPYLFQFPSYQPELDRRLIQRVTDRDSARVTLVYEAGTAASPLVQRCREQLSGNGVAFTTLSYGILEGRGIDTILLHRAHPRAMNRYVVASENEAFVSDVLRNLYLLSGSGIRISVYGTASWKNYSTIEPKYFHDLQVHLPLPYHTDYRNPRTRAFVEKYRRTFRAEPSPYAMQGYDIICYFVPLLEEHGWQFPVHVIETETELVQSGVRFIPIGPGSGFINVSGRTLTYLPNWEISY